MSRIELVTALESDPGCPLQWYPLLLNWWTGEYAKGDASQLGQDSSESMHLGSLSSNCLLAGIKIFNISTTIQSYL